MVPTVAYLAQGKLYIVKPGEKPRLIESPFVQGILDRAERSRQRNEWKQGGLSWGLNRGMGLPGGRPGAAPAEVRRVRYTGLAAGNAGQEIVYGLQTDYVSGLFAYDLATDTERRLIHRNEFRPGDLARRTADGTLTLGLAASDGTSHIAVMDAAGRGVREVTEGDALDEAPSWIPGDARALLFQTAGIGRDPQGFVVEIGPYAVHRLDLDAGTMENLIDDDAHDHLLPRAAADGSIYCVRRPYESRRPKISPLKLALDILLFPFRLAAAIVHFLNFFSLMFSRKPLLTAGGPPKEGPDARYMMLWGKLVDAEKALARAKDGDAKPLVPKSWQLLRRSPDGTEEILATSVLAYDLLPGGAVVYSNGTTIVHRDPAGRTAELCSAKLIERIVAIA